MSYGVEASTMTASHILVYIQITWGSCTNEDFDSVGLR